MLAVELGNQVEVGEVNIARNLLTVKSYAEYEIHIGQKMH
jgi:hypothetical protein